LHIQKELSPLKIYHGNLEVKDFGFADRVTERKISK